MKIKDAIEFGFIIFILISCAPAVAPPTATPVLMLSATPTAGIAPTSYTPFPTPYISLPTPSPTALSDSAIQQLIQQNYSIIQPENIAQLVDLVRYHRWEIQDFTGNLHQLPNAIESVSFNPKNYMLAFGSSDGAGLWDIGNYLAQPTSNRSRPVDIMHDSATKVGFSPDGQFVAVDGYIMQIFYANTHQLLFPLTYAGPVGNFTFSPEGNVLGMTNGMGGVNGRIEIWNWHELSTRYPENTILVHPEYLPPAADNVGITSVAFSPDGKMIASGVDFYSSNYRIIQADIFLWNFKTDQVINILGKENHIGSITSLSFNSEGNLLVSGSADAGGDGKVRLWDINSGRLLAALKSDAIWTNAVAFSPDGSIFAAGNQDGTIKFWDTKTYKLLLTIQAHIVRTSGIAFSFDGRFLASSGYDGTISIWGVGAPIQ